MKSKTNWIILGERNTSYFHISALYRRSKNRITCVQNNEGEWCHNIEEVKEIFNASFKKLYKTDQVFCPIAPQWRSDWCAKLSQKEAVSMANIPSDGEIWNALKSMKPYKALGVDGLHAGLILHVKNLFLENVSTSQPPTTTIKDKHNPLPTTQNLDQEEEKNCHHYSIATKTNTKSEIKEKENQLEKRVR